MPSPRTRISSINVSAPIAASRLLKCRMSTLSIPSSVNMRIFSRSVVRRAGASSGLKYSIGWGSKMITVSGRSCLSAS